MAWVDFAICLFFGILGVHKFREKKIGMGLLYLFTGGLFGFGWLYDCVKHAIIALNSQKRTTTYDSICGNDDKQTKPENVLLNPKNVWRWVFTVILIILALSFIPSFASLMALAGAALLVPIEKWQNKLDRYITGTYKTITIIALVVLTLATAPSSETTGDVSLPDITLPTYEITEFSQSTLESTSETTPDATTISTEPSTSATTASTTEVTTLPTAVPTTVPATKPPHTHNFSDATCTSPKTCSCGVTEGSTNGHNWNSATCTKPKTCSVCGATDGSAAGHSYTSGYCASCGNTDPNYVSGTMVWVSGNGKKYHSDPDCSNMKNPQKISKEEAEDRGREPCSKCYG